MTFHVGQKVVCVRVSEAVRIRGEEGYQIPREGSVYTIRSMVVSGEDNLCIRLHELHNPPRIYREGFVEGAFRAENFRPVIERKTDISALTALLNPANNRERIDA